MERKRRRHFIGDFGEKAPFYGLFEKTWKEAGGVFFMYKTMQEVGWSVILWLKLHLEGWLSRSRYIIGVA